MVRNGPTAIVLEDIASIWQKGERSKP